MTCYKCDSPENLSIKARNRDGSIRLMICKSCRKSDMRKYLNNNPKEEMKLTYETMSWKEFAKAKNSQVQRAYA